MDIQNQSYFSIQQLTDRYLKEQSVRQESVSSKASSFQEILQNKTLEQTGELKFSKHATGRLLDRGIYLNEEQIGRLETGTERARQKGIRDSLVIMDQLAFIVNIPNHTVITAMDSTQTEESIFTNINGAVIV